MDNEAMQIISVNTARTEHFVATNGETLDSAIRKRSREGRIAVGLLGLDGDEQADPSVHGGLTKAVYAYPLEHYAVWATLRGQAPTKCPWARPSATSSHWPEACVPAASSRRSFRAARR